MSAADISPDFWGKRASLGHIQAAAHARRCSAGAVLACCLARIASMLDFHVRLDVGLGPASPNLFAAVVGSSGGGKSKAMAVARDLIEAPSYLGVLSASQPSPIRPNVWVPDGTHMYLDGIPVGSGEGIAEAFMGVLRVPSGEEYKTGERAGEQKWKDARGQVRHNAFVSIDEGQALMIQSQRKGATIGAILRTAWMGDVIGQQNASSETTRIVANASYSLGLVVGFQPEASQDLLAESGLGSPQRFLFAKAADEHIPANRPEHPGPLKVDLTWSPDAIIGVGQTKAIEFDKCIRDEVDARELAKARGNGPKEDPLDSHKTLNLMKVAALLAILDGRWFVVAEDWILAKEIWRASSAIRDELVAHGKNEEAKASQRRAQGAAMAAVMTDQARESREEQRTWRVARWIANAIHSRPPGIAASRTELKEQMASRDKALFDDAMAWALASGWVARDPIGGPLGGERWVAGHSRPT